MELYALIIFINFFIISKASKNNSFTNNEKINSQKETVFNNDSYTSNNIAKKNLIIGVITNYDWRTVAPFFLSYMKAGFENCECVMFVGNMDMSTIEEIKKCGVIIYEIPAKYFNQKLINYRWKIYEDYLFENKYKYNLVFTADLRDVFFQKDLFKFYNSSKPFLGIAIEDGTLKSHYNQKWIKNAYGDIFYKMIENERIICVGTIWGTPDKFYEFSALMYKRLNSKWSLKRNAVEQGVTNYLIYHDKKFMNYLVKSGNEDGRIMTIGLTDRTNIKLDSENNVLNRRGQIAAAVHQYERHDDIKNIVINKFCPEICKVPKKEPEKRNNNSFIKCIIITVVIFICICLFFLIPKFLFKNKSNDIKRKCKILSDKLRISIKIRDKIKTNEQSDLNILDPKIVE